MDPVTVDEDGPLLLIGVNRPDANNLWESGRDPGGLAGLSAPGGRRAAPSRRGLRARTALHLPCWVAGGRVPGVCVSPF